MATRGDLTRERLLDVAERLFGEHGVTKVSLRQIRLAAEQGNAAVVQYHFGDRDGVVAALTMRHLPQLKALQARHIDGFADDRPLPFRRLVTAAVRPFADYVAAGPSARSWVKILAELASDPRVSLEMLTAQAEEQEVQIGVRLYLELCHKMPPELAVERVFSTYQFAIHVCANRAKVMDDPEAQRALCPHEAFAVNLVDMCAGALRAPVHASMQEG